MADNDIHGFADRAEKKKDHSEETEELYTHLTVYDSNVESPSLIYRHIHSLKQLLEHHEKEKTRDIDFYNLNKEDVKKILENIETSKYGARDNYSESQKEKWRSTLKKWIKVQEEDPDEIFPEDYKIYTRDHFANKTDRQDIPNPEEVKKFLQFIDENSRKYTRLRNLAFFFALWETGARVGELIRAKKNKVTVRDKTVVLRMVGNKDSPDREVECFFSAPILKRYIENHPSPDSDHLWVSIQHNKGNRLNYSPMRNMAVQAYKQLEDEIQVEWKGQPLHIFRKSMKTWFSNMKLLDETDLDVRVGHVIGSKNTRLYTRKDDEDSNRSLRQSLGLDESNSNDPADILWPKNCGKCGIVNSGHRNQCRECGHILDEKAFPVDVEREETVEKAMEDMNEEELKQKVKKWVNED